MDKAFWSGVVGAWHILRGKTGAVSAGRESPMGTAGWVAVLGAIAGIVLGAVGIACIYVVRGQPAAAALLAGIVAPWGWWLHNRGLFLGSTAEAMGDILSDFGAAGTNAGGPSPAPGVGGAPGTAWLPLLVVENLILLKCACVAVLVGMGAPLWVGLAPVVGTAVFADALASATEPAGENRQGAVSESFRGIIVWGPAVAVTVFLTLPMGLVVEGLAALLICSWLGRLAVRWIVRHRGAADLTAVRAGAELCESAILLLGVILATRMFM